LLPIYVGKAVPPGWRKARSVSGGTGIYSRLREHARSISQAENLKLEDFRCRFMVMQGNETGLISSVESALTQLYRPLWNTVVDGFGNHDPGSGRYNQAKSEWDVLHPGRYWAERLASHPVLSNVLEKIHEYSKTRSAIPKLDDRLV